MLTFNKILAITLLATLATAIKSEEITNIEKNVVESNPAETAVLTQLKFQESDSVDAAYNYKCTVGAYVSNRVACTAADAMSWSTPHNVEVKLRCPKVGSNLILSYVEINFTTTSPNLNCFVEAGGVGYGFISITLQAWNTLLLQYNSVFYTY